MEKTLMLRPRLSEQTYALAQTQRVYVFDVPADANKHAVARAVAAQFSVKVTKVNIANVKGKVKSTISLNGKRRAGEGVRSDIAKAYVKLAEGQSLPIFAAVEEAEEKEQKAQADADKAIAKQTKRAAPKKETPAPKASGKGLRIFRKQGDK
ncbi:MAG TPA: 50S ribosomal protein L23 [Candidatus Saccharimonadales bacterium]|nr:50S ribosomal protein L23 [Candidatus Saccharimonadales bacterium]